MHIKEAFKKWGHIAGVGAAFCGVVATAVCQEFSHDSHRMMRPQGIYRTELEVVVDFDSSPLLVSSGTVSTQQVTTEGLTSRLISDIDFRQSTDGLEMKFSNPIVELGGLVDSRLSQELGESVVVLKTSSFGVITEIGVTDKVSTQTVAILSQLVGQFPRLGPLVESEEEVAEQDVFGHYQAVYKWDEAQSAVTRTKVKYLTLDSRSFGDGAVGTIGPGQFWKASFDQKGLESMSAAETLLISKKGQKVLRQSVKFHMAPASGPEPGTVRDPQPLTWLSYRPGFVTDYQDPKLDEQIRKQELGNVTESDILNALPSISSKEAEVDWYRKVRAFIYRHPDRVEAFIPLLEEASLDSVAMRVVAPALGRIGHKESQATLRRLISLRVDAGRPSAPLFPLLVQTSTPVPETTQFVRTMIESNDPLVRSSAILAYGNLAATTRRVDPESRTQIISHLRHMLSSEKDPDLLRTLIFAAGNSESQEFLTDLVHIIERTSDPSIKGHGLEAIGALVGDQAFAKLREYLKAPDPALKRHALIGLFHQPYDAQLAGEISQLAKTHQNSEVRIAALDWVYRHREQMVSASGLFQEIRDRDSDQEVRKRAASILSVL
jgi:hypothetical protein